MTRNVSLLQYSRYYCLVHGYRRGSNMVFIVLQMPPNIHLHHVPPVCNTATITQPHYAFFSSCLPQFSNERPLTLITAR
jgi:hypothetical protein